MDNVVEVEFVYFRVISSIHSIKYKCKSIEYSYRNREIQKF